MRPIHLTSKSKYCNNVDENSDLKRDEDVDLSISILYVALRLFFASVIFLLLGRLDRNLNSTIRSDEAIMGDVKILPFSK